MSLYADDVLTYLADTTTSLSIWLDGISSFRHVSGFWVNWEKSLLFTFNQGALSSIPSLCLLKVVDSFQYLGVVVQQPIRKYLQNNLDSLISKLKNEY